MINSEVFTEMIKRIKDKDFILKVIQVDVILSKTTPINEDLEKKGNFVKRLVEENYHNGITEEHYYFAVDLYYYQCFLELKGLGGSGNISFPKINKGCPACFGSYDYEGDSEKCIYRCDYNFQCYRKTFKK